MPSWNFMWEDKMKLCFWSSVWHMTGRAWPPPSLPQTSIAHARGKYSKVIQYNHRALGKGRACSALLEDHLTCCAFATVLRRESTLGSAGGEHKGCGSLAWCRDALLPTGKLLCMRMGTQQGSQAEMGGHTLLDTPGYHQFCSPPTAELPSTIVKNGFTTSAKQTCRSCHSHFGSA